jgi:hypothetical protein
VIYGIRNRDTMKKAFAWLEAHKMPTNSTTPKTGALTAPGCWPSLTNSPNLGPFSG